VALGEPAPGTLPSKTLRETAVALSGLRARRLFGIDLSIRHKATISDFTHHQQQVSAGESERIDAFDQALVDLRRSMK
jgi:NAD(P) transhydrogenase